jgi:spoIIIJ-associated protein
MKTKIYEVKTIEEAISQAVKDLNLSADELETKIISEKKGFLGIGAKIEVEVFSTVDGIEKGKAYIQSILEANNVEGFIEKRLRGNVVELDIEAGNFNGVLIGKNSKHLISLQVLVGLVINNYYNEDEQKIIKIDVGGYRKRREHNLEKMAVEFGKQVVRTKQEIKLDNLNSYERKIIHDKLSTWKDVKTHSVGEEPDRYLIIQPK